MLDIYSILGRLIISHFVCPPSFKYDVRFIIEQLSPLMPLSDPRSPRVKVQGQHCTPLSLESEVGTQINISKDKRAAVFTQSLSCSLCL